MDLPALFAQLGTALEGAPGIALGAAFVWGVLSIVLSPCHLASIPLIVAFVGQQGQTSTRHAFWLSTLFATGILVTIGAIGMVTAALGRMLGDVGGSVNYIIAALFLVIGLHLLGVFALPFSTAGPKGFRGRGLQAAFVLGLVFGVALGPCTFAYMAPMLAVTLRMGATDPLYAAALLVTYGLGHCSVIVAAGTSTELVQRYVTWNNQSRATAIIRGVCGVLIIIAALYMIYLAA